MPNHVFKIQEEHIILYMSLNFSIYLGKNIKKFINFGKNVQSGPPNVFDYETFFKIF